MNRRRREMKNVYVLKGTPNNIEEKHKELSKKSLYLLKENEEAVHKYRHIITEYVSNQKGLFLVLSHDRGFYNNFRNSFYKELQIDQERIRMAPSFGRASKEIRVYRNSGFFPLIFLEGTMDGSTTLPYLEELKNQFKDLLVIILLSDIAGEKVTQYVEAGADNFITKPVSVNILIEKISNTLIPPDDIGKMVREGKKRLNNVEYALAYGVAREILERKPGSPAGLIIMGDALKGLNKRDEALKVYFQAMQNANLFLDPLKKIVDFYKEENDADGVLRYLLKIDELASLHMGRKQEIGEIYFQQKNYKKAAQYFADAVTLAHGQRLSESVRMAVKYADRIFNARDFEAELLLSLAVKLGKAYRLPVEWTIFNRLGMLLRRRKDWTGAIQAYSEASSRAPKDASILFNLGMAYVEGKEMGYASEKFERVITLQPALYKDNLDAAYIMGQVFIRANRPKNAAKVLGHIQQVQPGYKKVKSLLASIKAN